MFIDVEFGPTKDDDKGMGAICNDPEYAPFWVTDPDNIHWLRMREITNDTPYFLSGGAESSDVLQGDLGDCWFIGALSVIS